ncbi:hypothetical protein [Gymnodinialimonas hymeniacidonis]|uniref:hypothetical protein n=1 Tax=Gymnodinialimonas hymeniacidonis TaxID=3126508 RepID=UPI0034C6BC78
MTSYTRRNLPADITIFAGDFASQPLAFAHLLDTAPDLDLTHVEVIQSNHTARLSAYFSPVPTLPTDGTLILILPAAHAGLACPVTETAHLTPLGTFRGTVPHLSATP